MCHLINPTPSDEMPPTSQMRNLRLRGEGAFPGFHYRKVGELEFKPSSAHLSLSLSLTHTHTYTQMYLTKHGSAPGMDTVLALKEFSLVRWQMLD